MCLCCGQDRIVGERHRGYRTATQAFLGHEAHAQLASLPRVEAARLDAEDLYRELLRQYLLARDGAQQLLLAVTGDAGNADDLARVHIQVNVA
ncbi:hypothetical protein SDC9_164303 [bioreactor metagenome]|uniref:Uncharacterized protein n=1 Tax=bioreactor metagenome TaxID=1076179 RepID=A0A645FYJ0_9ZZZZ